MNWPVDPDLPDPDATRSREPVPSAVRESIIRIEHLSKVFPSKPGPVSAVDDISFEVKRGEIFGLLGPNGAGKSTLIRILTTLITPSSGAAFIDNFEVSSSPEQIRGLIGVCPQNSTLDQELTAYENLEVLRQAAEPGRSGAQAPDLATAGDDWPTEQGPFTGEHLLRRYETEARDRPGVHS